MLTGKTKLIFDAILGFYSEECFREMLVMEQKRSERSKKPFLLVMIDIDQMRSAIQESQFIKKLSLFVQASAREIDIKGWYERHRIIGIIFVECNTLGKDKIVDKIRANLEEVFGGEEANAAAISCTAFPEEKNGPGNKKTKINEDVADPRFYPHPTYRTEPKQISLAMRRCVEIVGSLAGVVAFLMRRKGNPCFE